MRLPTKDEVIVLGAIALSISLASNIGQQLKQQRLALPSPLPICHPFRGEHFLDDGRPLCRYVEPGTAEFKATSAKVMAEAECEELKWAHYFGLARGAIYGGEECSSHTVGLWK